MKCHSLHSTVLTKKDKLADQFACINNTKEMCNIETMTSVWNLDITVDHVNQMTMEKEVHKEMI